jgi:mitochondrial fission protein ELM1
MSRHEPDALGPSRLPAGLRAWILQSGKIGHEVNCLGVARELGLDPDMRPVQPRPLFAFFAPWGPIDPVESVHIPGSPLSGPTPDIVFASGRATAPYLRAIKRAAPRTTFTVFLQDPRSGPKSADLIWVPQHDRLRGDNVLVTLTSPHHLRPAVLRAARSHADPRLDSLPATRIGLVLGGDSGTHRFAANDFYRLAEIAREVLAAGSGLMVTPSRRTPPELMAAIRAAVEISGTPGRAFVWDGTGANPYAQILAHADAIVVTGDSVNMVGEAASTGVPVHVYEPTGGSDKMTGFIDRLVDAGAVRRLPVVRGVRWIEERWAYEPVDATAQIAREVVKRYLMFRGI